MNFYALLYAIESLGQLTRRPLPPVTLQLVGFTGAINFLQYIVNESFLPIYRYGVLPAYVVRRYFLTPNLFLSNFVHVNLMHFVTDSLSVLQVGSHLERFMLSTQYLKCFLYSSIAPNIVLVLITKLLSFCHRRFDVFYYGNLYFGQTSQIFCLSTILQLRYVSLYNVDTLIFGFRVPSQYALWVELFINQLLTPVPIVSHVSGVCAGLLYVYMEAGGAEGRTDFFRQAKDVVRLLRMKLSEIFGYNRNRINRTVPSWATHMEGAVNGGYVNNRLRYGLQQSASRASQSQSRVQLSMEEIRRRRLMRLDSNPSV